MLADGQQEQFKTSTQLLYSIEESLSTICDPEEIIDESDWAPIIGGLSQPLTPEQFEIQVSITRHKLLHARTQMSHRQRGLLWPKLLRVEEAQAVHSSLLYSKLLQFDNPEADLQIGKDVARTLSDLNLWTEDLNAGNNKLFNVLKAYANYDNEVGYVQGINYIVGMLLFYIEDEETVFWCLFQLMQGRWQWRWIYTEGLPKLQSLLSLLSE